jgi:hypothetical protein
MAEWNKSHPLQATRHFGNMEFPRSLGKLRRGGTPGRRVPGKERDGTIVQLTAATSGIDLKTGIRDMTEIQQLISRLRHEFPEFQGRYEEQSAGPEQEISAFTHFVVELYEQREWQQLQTAFDRIEEALTGADREVRELIAFEFLETLETLAASKPYGPEVLLGYLGRETRRIWAELDEISRTCSRLDMRERTVLEGEILVWRLVREALHRELGCVSQR